MATSESYRRAGNETGDMTKVTLINQSDQSSQSPPERSGICAPCIWFKESPMTRWTFAVMLLFGCLTPVWIVIRATGTLTGDILSGLCAFILAWYGANHFRILLGLKEQVDKYSKNNAAMKEENAAMKVEVNKLNK